jgi:hypothetical protein
VLSAISPLLLALWREQHAVGHEQTSLNFRDFPPLAKPVPLLSDLKKWHFGGTLTTEEPCTLCFKGIVSSFTDGEYRHGRFC